MLIVMSLRCLARSTVRTPGVSSAVATGSVELDEELLELLPQPARTAAAATAASTAVARAIELLVRIQLTPPVASDRHPGSTHAGANRNRARSGRLPPVSEVQQATSADGTPIAYRAWGDGPPIVFVHGVGTSGADWTFVQPLLRDRFTVVAMDRRGRGASGDHSAYAMEREAEDVLAVLDAVDAELLVGHSYGGLCSVLAAQRTDRLRRLVLYEPPIGVRERDAAALDELVARGDVDAALEAFLRGAGTPEDQLALIRSSPAWPVLLDAVPALPRELRAASEWRNPPGPIDVPTLYLLGADTTSPAYLTGLDDLLAAFPDLRRDVIPGQQHVGHVFAAPVFAELVADFCG
jgi:pimeloyl-ACP methyl ester carboxylesterase